ncbi:MAG: hypothetical protein AAGC43_04670 [Bacteroidota bacterium]
MAVRKFKKFFEALKKVLNDERTVILTDDDLLVLVNQQLPLKYRIHENTWKNWISGGKSSVEETNYISDEEAAEFRQLLKYTRVNQKMNLGANMMDENNKNQWGSSWILERKFKDLRLKSGNEVNINPTLKIEVGDSEAAGLIEGIINGDTIDIPHEEVKDETKNIEK